MKIQMMVCSLIVGAVCGAGAVAPDVAGASAPEVVSQWKGKKVAFLGDSITDKIHVGTSANYWNYLPAILGCDAYVYGKNGWQMSGMIDQARKLKEELGGDVDAIFIFAGTNDFNGGVPLGEWYAEEEAETRKNAQTLKLKHRRMLFDKDTFRGRINTLMAYLKKEFPDQQVILLTPIHRAYARFGEGNVQPDESWANTRGLFIDSYVNAVREAAGGDMRGVIGITEEPVVSSDFVGETRTCVFDATAGILLTLRNSADAISVSGALLHNLLPVTLGNIVGGAGVIALGYYCVYLKKKNG